MLLVHRSTADDGQSFTCLILASVAVVQAKMDPMQGPIDTLDY